MALIQPTAKTKTYTELVEEARRLIPGLVPTWTNHNPSDPGIALIELFAWLTEMALYRVERVPRANYEKFLCLLKGDPTWQLSVGPEDDGSSQADALEEEIRATIQQLRKPYRAITAEDYSKLVLKEWPQTKFVDILPLMLSLSDELETVDVMAARRAAIRTIIAETCKLSPCLPVSPLDLATAEKLTTGLKAFQVKRYLRHNFALQSVDELLGGLSVSKEKDIAHVARVIFVPERNLAGRAPEDVMPGHVSLIIISKRTLLQSSGLAPNGQTTAMSKLPTALSYTPTAGLRAALWVYLDERRLLTTRHHVVEPDFLPVQIEATLHLVNDALWDTVKSEAEQRLGTFFDPLSGGPQGKGWPLGRAVYPSEVYQVLENTPGVDYVTDVKIEPETTPGAHQLVAVTPSMVPPAP